jgi:GT2 family glycosyltransferase
MDVVGSCLKSVLSQDFDHPVEIIVHDDASTDDSVEFIRSHFSHVKLLTSDKNVGFCVSNNRMVAEARGRFVLLLNNDATLFPDALRTLHDYAIQQKRQGILGLPQYDMQTGEFIDIGSRLDLFLNPIPNLDRTRRQVGMVTGACFWIPKSLWDELGGFPEFFGSLAEDLYLCCLSRLRGYPVEAISQSGFHHWVGKSLGGGKLVNNTLRTSYRRRSLSERNKIYVMLLLYPLVVVILLVPVHWTILILEGLLFSLVTRTTLPLTEIYVACLKQVLNNLDIVRFHRHTLSKSIISGYSFFTELSPTYYKMTLVAKHGLPMLE